MKILAPTITLITGFALGWVAHPSSSDKDHNFRDLNQSSESKNRLKEFTKANRAFDSVTDKIDLNHPSKIDFSQLQGKDVAALLEKLANMGGFSGLTYEQKKLGDDLLKHWFSMDPDGAIKWADSRENRADRSHLLVVLAEEVSIENFDEGLSLVRKYLQGEKFTLPVSFLSKAASLSAEKFIEVSQLATTPGNSNDAWSSSFNFPQDFDFTWAAQELMKLEKSVEGTDIRLGARANNFLESWTKADPESAYNWLTNGGEINRQGMTDFVKGLTSIRTPDEVGKFLAEQFEHSPENQESQSYSNIQAALRSNPSSQLLEQFLGNVGGDRTQHIAGILRETTPWGEGRATPRLVVESLPEAERLAILKEPEVQKVLRIDRIRSLVTESLLALDHTPEEIGKIID